MYPFPRTDLASEARELFCRGAAQTSELPGVIAHNETIDGLSVVAVEITNSEGSQKLNKPIGKYFTLNLPAHFERGSENFSAAVHAASVLISRCCRNAPENVLIAALGNPDITPDALGSLAASHILVTRHMKSKAPDSFAPFASLSLCRTGVLGTSGIESAAHIASLCSLLSPQLVIAVDALAGAETERLCTTLQFTDTGISPGSGVGNDRQALNFESLGVPVIAVGMPTVIDAGGFCEGIDSMFVTPRSIDSLVRSAARVIGYGINLAVHNISIEDVDMLLG